MAAPFEIAGPTSPFAARLDQRYLVVPEFTLENGARLVHVPVAFQTWGKLNKEGTNALVICHPISGDALVSDWWAPLFGPGRVLDTDKYMVVCCNAIGSPYGTASPVTRRGGEDVRDGTWTCSPHVRAPAEQQHVTWWGSDFPASTIRDDVRYVW